MDNDLGKYGKEFPLKVPDGFFQQLSDRTVRAVREREIREGKAAEGRPLLKRALITSASVAACIAMLILLRTPASREVCPDGGAGQFDKLLHSLSDEELAILVRQVRYDPDMEL